jgi:hypothetical protein
MAAVTSELIIFITPFFISDRSSRDFIPANKQPAIEQDLN